MAGTGLPQAEHPQGGAWLLSEADGTTVFTPEKLTEEHRMMARTTEDFVETEVLPHLDRLEAKDWEFARTLVRKGGELGLLGINVPEAYGGLELDKTSSLLVAERIARSASFGATYGAQANLCILPIAMFGTDQQKQQYLPGLVSGEMVGAYALSESTSGSDALAARTRASRLADGDWSLTGEKMWITNGGFADVFIVFAKVDGEQFTAFIVERGFPGVTSGKEEHKMGLHGSSTTPIVLQEARVPAANVLGEIGKGHKVALNTLNFGRFKLGAMCTGGCRHAVGQAARYAAQRKQFGQPIASFGAIQHKLGEMVARTYATESLMYRTSGLIDAAIAAGMPMPAAFEEFAVEASIAKVAGSEALDFVLDENIQIHGGNGYVREYGAERVFRDARVNRIFEGTNEINRMLITGMLARRAAKGELPLIPAALRLQEEVLGPAVPPDNADDGDLARERQLVTSMRKVAVMVLGTAMQTYGAKLQDEQEVLSYAADILIDLFASDSTVIRAAEAKVSGAANSDLHEAAARLYTHDAVQRIEMAARSALAAMAEGDALRTLLAALRRLLKPHPVNTVLLRRRLAAAVVAEGGYILNR